jgi:asparagine synthase (glutamine-hydrolysing)
MCGIAGIVSLEGARIGELRRKLAAVSRLIAHRGPDGAGVWTGPRGDAGLVHRRLSIIDLSAAAHQPMQDEAGRVITYNGEIYNYLELQRDLAPGWRFRSRSDTECILAAYDRDGDGCLERLRGMFAFALWDERRRRLFCARDRFGIKPFYYAVVDGCLVFASEIKALLPLLPAIETDTGALAEYLTFQYTLGEHTLFKGVRQLLPGHALAVEDGRVRVWRYWDVHYHIDHSLRVDDVVARLRGLVDDSVAVHLRSDVPVGAYLSGGVDSTLVGILAAEHESGARLGFHGKFTDYPGYDESRYARIAAAASGTTLHELAITAEDFRANAGKLIYHLDQPVAGPGSFPQFMVSGLAAKHVKVVLGGQGGDEIFGGYARYLIAYFEQCIKAAIEGNYRNGNFVVTAESIIPNLTVLQEYQPLMRQFWSKGLFGPMDARYFRLIDRSADMESEVDWSELDREPVFAAFQAIFNNERNVRKEAYFDSMTHFDFKCLLPALLHVEDRMSMAHGIESRVPLLDHALVEFAAAVPADVKFKDGHMKHLLKIGFADKLPEAIVNRRDKMGFPVPLKEWFAGELRDMMQDIFRSERARSRPFLRSDAVLAAVDNAERFSRKLWGLLSLELWQQQFHDQAHRFRALLDDTSQDIIGEVAE